MPRREPSPRREHLLDLCPALEALGTGFLADPALLTKLATGALPLADYHDQLLRLVVRLVFLAIAEARDLLHIGATRPSATTGSRRTTPAGHDLWRGLRRTLAAFDDGDPDRALPALGGPLWRRAATPDLEAADLADADLLAALTALDHQPVPWDSQGDDALGWAHEALIDRTPSLDLATRVYRLVDRPGRARTTGSYYTPPALVDAVLRVALDPLIAERLAEPEPAAALLALRVCDPACGAGHFLVPAARRIARALALARAGPDPTPADHRRALRDVVGRCIFGVDLDPTAVSLCKVALWLAALEPGSALPLLDHHIRHGDAVLGAPAGVTDLPPAAFATLEGDDPAVARSLRHRLRSEPPTALASALEPALVARFAALDIQPDRTRADLRAREHTFAALLADPTHQSTTLTCDLWCAAFVWPKTPAHEAAAPTPRALSHRPVPEDTLLTTAELAATHAFFHWHLAFPHVFAAGGFDLVLGNPPWETLSPDAKEFFAAYDPRVRALDRAGQQQVIHGLLRSPELAAAWTRHRRRLYALVHFLKTSGRYRLHADGNLGKGDFNLYRPFVELALAFTRPGGVAAQIVPDAMLHGTNGAAIRRALLTDHRLTILLGLENARGAWFPGIHTAAKFTIYAARPGGRTDRFVAAFGLRSPADLRAAQAGGVLEISAATIHALAPDTLTVPEIHDPRDLEIAAIMHARWPRFGERVPGGPHRHLMRELDMGNDRARFRGAPPGLPLYEGRMIAAYDHRARAWRAGRGRSADWRELAFTDPDKAIAPQWWIPQHVLPARLHARVGTWRLGFCDVASPGNERSLVAALVPPGCVCGDKVPTLVLRDDADRDDLPAMLAWLALANSFTIDFLVRQRIGLKISYAVLDGLPFPRLAADDPTLHRLAALALRLTCTSPCTLPLWDTIAARGLVPARTDDRPGLHDPELRLAALAAIEAIVAHLYGLTPADLAHILDAFPVLRRRDERAHGEYRTKRRVLAALTAPA